MPAWLSPRRVPIRARLALTLGGVLALTFAIVGAGTRLRDRNNALAGARRALLIGGPLALLVASGVGYAIAIGALRPVERMRRRAATMSAPDLDATLPLPEAQDEIRALGVTFNAMLERLRLALARERSLVADAGHELRTPLAILKAEVEVALRGDATDDELRAALVAAGRETERLIVLADDLLVLSSSDRDELPLRRARVSAAPLLDAVSARFAPIAMRSGRVVEVAPALAPPAALDIDVDGARIEQALGILVDNALRHGDGPVTLSARRDAAGVELHVTDAGMGFPADFLPRAQERFSRADPGRTGTGTGLGLAIAAAIATAHGGAVHLANVAPGRGADVWLTLPGAR